MMDPVLAEYFDEDALRSAPRPLYRVDGANGRMYSVLEPKPMVFPSVTTIIGATMPTPKHLLDWISAHGKQQAERMRDASAAYGTWLHVLLAQFLITRSCDVAALPSAIEEYVAKNKLTFDTSHWAETAAEDLVGFATFARQYKVKPLGIEVPLASEALGWAGTLDLVAIMEFPRTKLFPAGGYVTYLDWKSSRKSFYDSGIIQCHMYKPLWDETFPEKKIERLLLYGCKDWDEGSREPYRMQDVTAHPLKDMGPLLHRQYKMMYPDLGVDRRPRIHGIVSLDTDPFEVNVKFKSGIDALRAEIAGHLAGVLPQGVIATDALIRRRSDYGV